MSNPISSKEWGCPSGHGFYLDSCFNCRGIEIERLQRERDQWQTRAQRINGLVLRLNADEGLSPGALYGLQRMASAAGGAAHEPETVPVPDKAEGTDVCRFCYFTPDKCICTPPPPFVGPKFKIGDRLVWFTSAQEWSGVVASIDAEPRYRVNITQASSMVLPESELRLVPTKCAGDANG
jgi:hypothetical protein